MAVKYVKEKEWPYGLLSCICSCCWIQARLVLDRSAPTLCDVPRTETRISSCWPVIMACAWPWMLDKALASVSTCSDATRSTASPTAPSAATDGSRGRPAYITSTATAPPTEPNALCSARRVPSLTLSSDGGRNALFLDVNVSTR